MVACGAALGANAHAPPSGFTNGCGLSGILCGSHKRATGATGDPVAPTNGSGIADSRNA